MKILFVKSRILSNTAFFQFVKDFAAIIIKYDVKVLKVNNVLAPFVAFFASLQAGLDKEKSSLITKLLNDLDLKRDILIEDFTTWLEVMTRFPDPAIAEKATNLYHYLTGFGKGIAKLPNQSESAVLTNIVDGFTTDATRSASLDALNGKLWVSALGAVNNDYITQSANRVADGASDATVESFSSTRKKTSIAYVALIDLLTNRYGNDKADGQAVLVYEKCIGELNELITKTNVSAELSRPNKVEPPAPPTVNS